MVPSPRVPQSVRKAPSRLLIIFLAVALSGQCMDAADAGGDRGDEVSRQERGLGMKCEEPCGSTPSSPPPPSPPPPSPPLKPLCPPPPPPPLPPCYWCYKQPPPPCYKCGPPGYLFPIDQDYSVFGNSPESVSWVVSCLWIIVAVVLN